MNPKSKTDPAADLTRFNRRIMKWRNLSGRIIFLAILGNVFGLHAQPTSFQSRGIGGGGALFSPSINPDQNEEVYMACDMSEVFHSTDFGQTWNMLHFKTIQGGHDSRMQFTKDAKVRYCIDYTSLNGIDYTRPVKSTDGGKTWKLLAGNPYPNEVAYHLSADYDNPDRLVLGFYGEIWFSKDGGTTFKKIYTCKSNGEGNHIAGTCFRGNDLYLGLNDGLLKSSDGGSNWALMNTSGMPSGEKMLSFSSAYENGNLRFACLTLNGVWAGIQHAFEYSAWDNANSRSVAAMQGIYIMDNADGSWKPRFKGIDTLTDFPVFTGMAQNNVSTLYIAGGSVSGSPIVMKSTDGGNTWKHQFLSNNNQNITTGWSGYQGDRLWSYGECPFGFAVAANDVSRVVFTDFGFAHGTTDGGANWKQMYVDPSTQNPGNAATPKQRSYKGIGLENTTNWNLLWTDSTHLMASFSDINGVMSADKGKTWKFIPNLIQNSVYHMVQHSNGTIYAATSNVHDLYQSTRLTDNILDAGKGGVYYSVNQGSSFGLLHDFGHPVIWLALDPANPKRLYASVVSSAVGGIYVSDDIDKGASSSWKKLANPPRTEGHAFVIRVLKGGELVVSYSGRRTGSPQQFSASSGVFFSNNGGISWSDRSHNNMKYWTKDVTIDPFDTSGSTWYAAVFSGWGSAVPVGTGGLYRTTDKGLNWSKISDPNASYRVNSCAINPQNKEELYYTTETDGLWFTKNASAGSPTFALVDAYPFRHPVRVSFNPYKNKEVWVSGFGSGMMIGTVGSPNTSGIEPPSLKKIIFPFPNPATDIMKLEVSQVVELKIIDIRGKLHSGVSWKNEAQSLEININHLPPGFYFLEYREGDQWHCTRFIKQ